jgi:hypothetical protein
VGQSGYVIYRPGGVATGNVATTFPQLQTAVANGAVDIYIDSSIDAATIPAGGTLQCGGYVRFYSFANSIALTAGSDLLTVEDTGLLQDPATFDKALTVKFACLTAPALAFTPTDARLEIKGGAVLNLLAGATVPAFSSAAGQVLQLIFHENSTINGVTGVPCLSSGTTGTVVAFVYNSAGSTGTGLGGAGTTVFQFDASVIPPTFSVGTVILVRLDSDALIGYTVTTTGGRPTANLVGGQMSFDSTLGIPIWRNAANSGWVNATGGGV